MLGLKAFISKTSLAFDSLADALQEFSKTPQN